jgi:hypothetical protein
MQRKPTRCPAQIQDAEEATISAQSATIRVSRRWPRTAVAAAIGVSGSGKPTVGCALAEPLDDRPAAAIVASIVTALSSPRATMTGPSLTVFA